MQEWMSMDVPSQLPQAAGHLSAVQGGSPSCHLAGLAVCLRWGRATWALSWIGVLWAKKDPSSTPITVNGPASHGGRGAPKEIQHEVRCCTLCPSLFTSNRQSVCTFTDVLEIFTERGELVVVEISISNFYNLRSSFVFTNHKLSLEHHGLIR